MPLVYSFVAKGATVLAEATQPAYEGNFQSVGVSFLERCPTDTDKFVFPVDDLTFNYVVDEGFVFLAVADRASGRELPYAYLDAVKNEFRSGNHAAAVRTPAPLKLQRAFEPVLKEKMRWVEAHPEEVSKIKGLQRQVREVQQVMENNIHQVLQRGERLENIGEKTERLQAGASQFRQTGNQLRKKMLWQNRKWWIILSIVILIVLVIIFLSICFSGGNRCFN